MVNNENIREITKHTHKNKPEAISQGSLPKGDKNMPMVVISKTAPVKICG